MSLITFEGVDGAGKTTQIQRLITQLEAAGQTPLLLREPGGTEMGEQLRDVLKGENGMAAPTSPVAELMLFNAARAELFAQAVKPALTAGQIVILDRHTDSSLAYQGYGRGLDLGLIRRICNDATDSIAPDLTILLRLDADERHARVTGRGEKDAIERSGDDFFNRVVAGFDELAAQEPERFHVIDATRSVEDISHEILAIVQERFFQETP